jgi:tetratricopeptide (TPR) repeat protein
MAIIFIAKPYPPSFLALSELQAICLSELRLETRHQGLFVVLKATSKPQLMVLPTISVEDRNGKIGLVQVLTYNRDTIATILAKDQFLAIKEPFLTTTADGIVVIRVDHPSNLVPLESDSGLLPPRMTRIPIELFTPTERAVMGNKAMKNREWRIAIRCFSGALAMKQHDRILHHTLYLDRSQAYHNLGCYELALQDALAAFMSEEDLFNGHKSHNSRSMFQAGRASYDLRKFSDAKKCFSLSLEISPSPVSPACFELFQTEKRLTEQETGEYDFETMLSLATKGQNLKILDHASFLKNTKIASAGSRGRGLFASKGLAPGELVMVEKAFYITSEREAPEGAAFVINMQDIDNPIAYRGKYVDRMRGLIQKILFNPTQASRIMDLYDGGNFQNQALKFVDGMATVDMFRIEAITRLNAFACPGVSDTEDDAESAGTGIWVHASHANHSCIPNADRTFIGDMMVIRANREIEMGEEISFSYCNSADSYPERQAHLSAYGFDCDCPLCGRENTIPEYIEERAALLADVNRFISIRMAGVDLQTLTENVVLDAEELLEQLENTYPNTKYDHLPRLECVPLSYWLCLIHGSPEKKLTRALRALRNHGYFIDITDGVTIDRTSAVPLVPALGITLIATAACLQLGKKEAAQKLEGLRKEVYTILYACENGFDDLYGRFNG